MMERYEDLIINNSKALALAEQIKDKRKNQIKIEFYVKERYHAVWISENKYKKLLILMDQKGITIQQYYINKYS